MAIDVSCAKKHSDETLVVDSRRTAVLVVDMLNELCEEAIIMKHNRIQHRISRRKVLAGGAVLGATGLLGFPGIIRADTGSVRIGLLQPLSGGLEALGNQGIQGSRLALE